MLIQDSIEQFRLAQLGRFALEIVSKRLGIDRHLEYFFKNNNTTAEYHSNYHSICVALNVYEGCCFEGLSLSETRTSVLAGIFHDFNHSGGTMTDDKNIDRAIIGLTAAVTRQTSLTEEEFSQTVQTLKITKYPYEKDPVTPMEQIIRDADLMQPYEEADWILKNQYLGLKTEIERARGVKFTVEEYAKGQRQWLDENVVWHSSWAIKKAATLNWEATKQRLVETMNGA